MEMGIKTDSLKGSVACEKGTCLNNNKSDEEVAVFKGRLARVCDAIASFFRGIKNYFFSESVSRVGRANDASIYKDKLNNMEIKLQEKDEIIANLNKKADKHSSYIKSNTDMHEIALHKELEKRSEEINEKNTILNQLTSELESQKKSFVQLKNENEIKMNNIQELTKDVGVLETVLKQTLGEREYSQAQANYYTHTLSIMGGVVASAANASDMIGLFTNYENDTTVEITKLENELKSIRSRAGKGGHNYESWININRLQCDLLEARELKRMVVHGMNTIKKCIEMQSSEGYVLLEIINGINDPKISVESSSVNTDKSHYLEFFEDKFNPNVLLEWLIKSNVLNASVKRKIIEEPRRSSDIQSMYERHRKYNLSKIVNVLFDTYSSKDAFKILNYIEKNMRLRKLQPLPKPVFDVFMSRKPILPSITPGMLLFVKSKQVAPASTKERLPFLDYKELAEYGINALECILWMEDNCNSLLTREEIDEVVLGEESGDYTCMLVALFVRLKKKYGVDKYRELMTLMVKHAKEEYEIKGNDQAIKTSASG